MSVILVTTSALLLYKAIKADVRVRESVRWEGTLTVILTTVGFMVSYLPDSMIVLMLDYLSLAHPSSSILRATSFFENINIVANVFVYSLTVGSFREFLSSRIRLLARRLGFISPVAPRTVRQTRPLPRARCNLPLDETFVETAQ